MSFCLRAAFTSLLLVTLRVALSTSCLLRLVTETPYSFCCRISGFFIDDFWCSDIISGRCTDPVQGATEINPFQQMDMGLTDDDIKQLTLAWSKTMGAVQKAIVGAGGYTWSLIPGQENANASPIMMTNVTCAPMLRKACKAGSRWQKFATLFGCEYPPSLGCFSFCASVRVCHRPWCCRLNLTLH